MLSWLKNNKVFVLLLLVVAYFVWDKYRYNLPQPLTLPSTRMSAQSFGYGGASKEMAMTDSLIAPMPPQDYYEGVSTSANRMVVQNSNMSLVVLDVRDTGNKIIDHAKSKGGFMVDASYNRPEESAFGTVTVRIPTTELDASLELFRELSVKVSNEYIQGTDVTEQYTDVEERLSTLEGTKTKFEQILADSSNVQDILQVQQQLIYIQDQIDMYVGQRDALEKNASLTKVTVYLSTDELSLPYTPDQKFRPAVIFKLAVRSLMLSLQGFGEFIIWAVVYSVIWIPALIILMGVKNFLRSRK